MKGKVMDGWIVEHLACVSIRLLLLVVVNSSSGILLMMMMDMEYQGGLCE